MKKYFSFLVAAVLMLGFAACSDVPAPYSIFDDEYEGGGDSPSGGIVTELPYAEAFSSSLGKFVSINTSGSGDWIIDFSTAKAAGYNNTTKVTTPGTYYLVSPEIQLPEEACHIMFEYILRYVASNDDQQLLISDSWNEEAPTEGWTLVNNVFTEGRDWNTFAQADINVPEQFQGKTVRIAFRYNCGESGSTWEIKNLVINTGTGQDGQIDGGGDNSSDDIVTELPYAEAFSSSLGKFVSVNTSGSGNWIIDFSTAKAAGYNNTTKVTTPGTYYLVSPEIQLPEEACHIMFDYILRYMASNDDQQLLISDSWNEEAPTEGWTLVNNVFTEGRDWNTFAQADINVPEQFQGKTVRIAFRYNCGESGSTWEIKNFVINTGTSQDKQIDDGGQDPTQGGDDPTQGGGEDPGDLTGSSITLVAKDFGLANGEEITSLQLPGSTIILNFSTNEGTTTPKFYNAGNSFRLYAQNSLTVTALDGRTIKAIVFTCDLNGGTAYVGNEQMTSSSGRITKQASATPPTVTVSAINAPEVTITNAFTENKAGTQFRIVSMQVIFDDGTSAVRRWRR